ncbi:MAG TPA: signal peptidase I [Symbiobacteriaceae bacterium]|nr:signal peptidase I [Symbiobacteriaceae bacterium]
MDRGVEEEPLKRTGPNKPAKSELREWLETIGIALVLALLLRTLVVQVYKVEGESMLPNFHTGEMVLVNKFIYKVRAPHPGEVVVLDDPMNPRRQLIKRVIAVAGETVEIKDDQVYINGRPLAEDYIDRELLRNETLPVQTVPAETIFVMGDNRGNSSDSRRIGPIPVTKLEGKAFFRYWPLSAFGRTPLDLGRSYQAKP